MLDLPKTHQDALLLTAQYSTLVCMKELLEKFVIDFHITDKKKNHVLHRIMMRDKGEQDKLDVLKLFYDNGNWHGLDLNACNQDGFTILDMVGSDEIELAEYLESKGAKRAITMGIVVAPFALQFAQYQMNQNPLLAPLRIVSPTSTEVESNFKLN